MSALYSLFRFELRYQVFSPTFIVSFGLFFLITFAATVSEQVQIGGPSSVNINAPSAILLTYAILGLFGLFIPTAMLANSVIRDSDHKTADLFHSTPISPPVFILGRFLGGYTATLLAYASVPLALFLGCMMPWINPDRLGPATLFDFAYPFFVMSAVNMLIAGLVFFTVANITRSIFATYIALIAFLTLFFVGSSWGNEPEYRAIAAIADPMGLNTSRQMMQYWTASQLNTDHIPLTGTFLINRTLWLSVSVVLLAINLLTFRFRISAGRSRKKTDEPEASAEIVRVVVPKADVSTRADAAQLWTRVRFEVRAVVGSAAFWILLALGVLNTFGALTQLDSIYGTPSYPLTRIMVNVMQGAFTIIPLIVAVYYASELVWRERIVGIYEVVDSTPTPNWVFVASKFVALSIVIFALFMAGMGTAIAVQLMKGYTQLEFAQYAERLLIDMIIPMIFLAALCLFLQVVTNNRWFGIIGIIVYIIVSEAAASFGYDHRLIIFGAAPTVVYSDMNGYGHFLPITLWFLAYWGFWSLILGTLSYILWNRGALHPLTLRLRTLPQAGVGSKLMLTAGTAGMLLCGGWIYYNTNILNKYMNEPRTEQQGFAFEDKYRDKFEFFAQPKVIGVDVQVDIYPEARRATFEGRYQLINRTDAPIDTVIVDYDREAKVVEQSLDGAKVDTTDLDHNVFQFAVDPPWPPGEKRSLVFSTDRSNIGFRNQGNISGVIANGTFLNNGDGMPLIGFNGGKLIQARNVRRRYGRAPLPRAYKLEDERFWRTNSLRPDSDWVTFTTTVSTVVDQIAIAPGYLAREWEADGRRYFRYEMDRPIQNFFSFQSADYKVLEEEWNGIKLQVFYHEAHTFNVDRIMTAMRESLDYFSQAFSPFQYRQMRILEFPAYASFAQSFANTVPFSESIGYVLDLRDAKSFDVAYYVTAHEVAHQWWGHQIVPSAVQGGTMVVETFAQYGALLAVEKKYGPHQMRRFLGYELDAYLRGRASEPEAERPLYRVENQQYIHYRKGAVVMYELRDRLGEDVVNRSLARFIEEYGERIDPYPRTVDYLRILREEAGPQHETLIADLFERIMLYDLRVIDATVEPTSNGRYKVSIEVQASKLEADEKGEETERPLDTTIDIGVFSQDPDDVYEGQDHVLFLEKRRVVSGKSTIEVVVDQVPAFVGIDPYHKMIDRVSADNLKPISSTDTLEAPVAATSSVAAL